LTELSLVNFELLLAIPKILFLVLIGRKLD
jgi:hypothetical protein